MPILNLLSIFQRFGMWLRSRRRKVKFGLYVVSFGGITLGGVGKTPAVLSRAELELKNGKKVCVVSRGYKGKKFLGTVLGRNLGGKIMLEFYRRGKEKIKEKLVSIPEACRIIGDELTLVLFKLPSVTVLKDSNRVRALSFAEELGFDIAILDDGFQYLMVEKDEDVVLINALNPWGNKRIFPAGILREPLTSLGRATEIYITHADYIRKDDLVKLIDELKSYCGIHKRIRLIRYLPVEWIKWDTKEKLGIDSFRNMEVDLYCALGSPDVFFKTLGALGIRVRNKFVYRDHCLFPREVILGDVPLLTTEKNVLSLELDYPKVYALSVKFVDYTLDS
ncbi:MAG: tetraacyldisaccharide 4'-kinase [Candidatus Hydrogenedentes bacterium]|nr:tetraacyldisaccharide 4'-kinase [Candidatus Hydrogenedentota bacterium]